MRLVNQMMGDEQTAMAQMIYMALASAPAQAFTTFVSGYLYDALVADGLSARRIKAGRPYDLILAKPWIGFRFLVPGERTEVPKGR